MITVFAQIEKTQELDVIATIYRTAIWKYTLWLSNYQKNLAFMADTDDEYQKDVIDVINIYVDYAEYQKSPTLDHCIANAYTWFLDGADLYVHFIEHTLPIYTTSIKNGNLIGVTSGDWCMIDNIIYKPGITSYPVIEESMDNDTYGKMVFNEGEFEISNRSGIINGDYSDLFGNEFNVYISFDKENILRPLFQYYIYDIVYEFNKTIIKVKDKRERLSSEIPNEYFTLENYPYINESLIDTIIPDAYGKCSCVPGTCINEEQAMSDNWRHFKFARMITSNLYDTDFIIEAEIGKKWQRLPRSATEYELFGYGPASDYNATTMAMFVNKSMDLGGGGDGTVSIPVLWAHEDGNATKGLNQIRLTAIFNPQRNPGAIVLDMLTHYGLGEYPETDFDLDNWDQELLQLGSQFNIGIVLKEQSEIFDYIEKIQNQGLIGFQLFTKFDKYIVKVDNPNRTETFNIKSKKIINMTSLSASFNADNYCSYLRYQYQKNWTEEDLTPIYEDRTQWRTIMNLHKFDKVNEDIETLLFDKAQVQLKAQYMLEYYSKLRPVISDIRLKGKQYFDINLFDIGWIDFSFTVNEVRKVSPSIIKILEWMSLKENMARGVKALTKDIYNREFLGKLRVQVINKSIDLETEEIVLSVRQRDPSSIIII